MLLGNYISLRAVPVLLAIGAMFCTSAGVSAGELSETFFRIDVSNSNDSAFFEVLSQDVEWDPDLGGWSWSDVGITLGDIASLDQANLTILGDPQIGLNFAMTAFAQDITVTISSAILSFGPFVNPDGLASAGLTLTESNGDTATLTGLGGAGGSAYVATYNTPPGTIFAEFVPQLSVSEPYGSVSGSASTGWLTISDTVTNMQAQFNFILTAMDQASGTSIYVIIPEPASLALLALGGLALGRRRS
ncbi:MAG: PEP-CTERM sorting domain-containing protein [Phycisphaerae bacterium]